MTDDVKERAARAMAMADGSKDPDALFAPPQTMNSPRDPYPVWMEWLGQVDASFGALRPGDEIDLGEFGTVVLAPKEAPAPKWLDRVAEEIAEYRGLTSGWDGENAEAPSAHSVDEAIEFIRSLERGDIEPALHADGTVIILIGHTTLRFTNEGMSFVPRAAIAAAKETRR